MRGSQGLNGFASLVDVVNGADVNLVAQDGAQHLRVFCHRREADDGIAVVAGLGQADGAQDVADAGLDVDHGEQRLLPDQLRSAAAGEHHVEILRPKALCDVCARLQVAHKAGEAHLRQRGGLLRRHGQHALVGRDAQNTNLVHEFHLADF